MLAPRRSAALLLALPLALVGVLGCKRKTEARALSQDDGRNQKQACHLAAGGVIAADAIVRAGCVVTIGERYLVTKGATLTIEPGAKLSFKKGASLAVQDGALVAKGTTTEPVVFTSAEAAPSPGDWGGIVFAATQKPSTLEHVVVEWAGAVPPSVAVSVPKPTVGWGAASGSALADRAPAVHVSADAAKLTLVRSTIRHAPRVGLTADGAEPFERFEGNAFDSNGGFAMDVPAAALGAVASIDSTEPVRVRGRVLRSQTWPRIQGGIVVASLLVSSSDPALSAVLTLAPETIVRVEPRIAILIGDYSDAGSLVAKGAHFMSAADKPARGDWSGIRFGKRSPGTVLDGCLVEHAGYEPLPLSKSSKSSTTKKPSAPVALSILEHMKDFKIVNTTFRDNPGPGMGLGGGFSLLVAGTGGCEGLDAPKNGNKSIGQPLCEYHEDPFANLGMLGAFGTSSVGTTGLFGDGGDAFGSSGLGTSGGGLGGGGLGTSGVGTGGLKVSGGGGGIGGKGTGAGHGNGGTAKSPSASSSASP